MEYLKEYHIVHSLLGLTHFAVATLSVIFGTIVVLNQKGTRFHKRIGYTYVCLMAVTLLTAFMIDNFSGDFSLFHFFAVISFVTLSLGIYQPLVRKAGWLEAHFQWMSWSVVGLYAALWAEIGTRFFEMRYFWWIVMIALILTTIIGRSFIKKFENNSLYKFKSFDTRTA